MFPAYEMGRMMSPDPQTPTPLHLLNPQRWNMYAYGLNNPLSFTDSGGKDAAAVNFSNEIVIVGHEGILSVHADGTATYARFGPLGGNSPTGVGQVQSFTLETKVQFDSNRQPTANSLNAVKNELANSDLSPEKGQDPSSIRLNYFKTTDGETTHLIEGSHRGTTSLRTIVRCSARKAWWREVCYLSHRQIKVLSCQTCSGIS
jgi:hypothetical protein